LYRYRAAEFQIGAAEYERQGRTDAALREALDLGRLNPERRNGLWALVTVARLEQGRGRDAPAREALEGATRLAAADPALLLQVGDVWSRLLGDDARARAAYRSALGLAPPAELRAVLEERLAGIGGEHLE
jgi:hypothetical protein